MSSENQMKHTDRIRQHRRRMRRRQNQRRGVLLLVVLSMLVLFLLLGTTFVVIANSYRQSSKAVEKTHETSLQAGDRLERALQQVLFDTNNPHSSIRYHSLLRDMYGTDGFVGNVYSGNPRNASDLSLGYLSPQFHNNDPGDFPDYVPRYAGATNGNPLGPTSGQFIDIFVQDDLGQNISPGQVGLAADYVVDLEPNAQGMTTNHRLSRTGGYYNGCLLTVLDGPAKGQTTRIVQYDYLTEFPNNPNHPVSTGVARFRVLAFPRSDGGSLNLGLNPQRGDENDLIRVTDTANPFGTIRDNDTFHGARIMVNGRPNSGTGVGYNPFAGIADHKLNAVEVVTLSNGQPVGLETALMPNSRFFDFTSMGFFDAAASPGATSFGGDPNAPATFQPLGNQYTLYPGAGGSDESYDAADFQNMFLALQSLQPRPRAQCTSRTRRGISISDPQAQSLIDQDFEVQFDLDGVPIPSFHRPALVNFWIHRLYKAPWLVAAVPGPQERVKAILAPYDTSGVTPVIAAQIVAIKRKISLRPLREDHPNFDGSNPESQYVGRFKPNPTGTDPQVRMVDQNGTTNQGEEFDDQITFPFWEATGPWDVDNDNDGVPDSIWVDLGDPVQELGDGRLYKPLYAILIEDMDGRLNLNAHGSQDHLAGRDLDPSQQFSGNGFQPFFPTDQNNVRHQSANGINLPSGASSLLGLSLSRLLSTNQLPSGGGWGPGDISLRPILSPSLLGTTGYLGDPNYDDYARLFDGRVVMPANNPYDSIASESAWGRYGSTRLQTGSLVPGPGITYDDQNPLLTIERRTAFDFYEYPRFDKRAARRLVVKRNNNTRVDDFAPADGALADILRDRRAAAVQALGGEYPSGFSTSPDLRGVYATGLSYSGPAVVEAASDMMAPPMQADTPYEIGLMEGARRDAPQNYNPLMDDDAPFSPGELERILRASDADAGRLPDRLWNVVNAFDPDKLVVELTGPNVVQLPTANGPTSAQLVNAQLEAAIRRRAVTTESYEVPAPSENWNKRLIYGADGRPGAGGVDENGNWDNSIGDSGDLDDIGEYNVFDNGGPTPIDTNGNGVIDSGEIGNVANAEAAFDQGIDDYLVIMGAAPRPNARLLDYMRYRVTLELKRKGAIPKAVLPDADRAVVATGVYPFTLADLDGAEARINLVIYGDNSRPVNLTRNNAGPVHASYGGLLAPEVLSGLKMDLNRPFGDGKDNNGNGVVDEEAEAGEPWVDVNGDGIWRNEPYLDLDGDGRFYADTNNDGRYDPNDPSDWIDVTADGVNNPQPVVDSLFAEQLGRPLPFDYTHGTDVNGRGAVAGGSLVHDDGRMARQLYARHLYCLMLTVADENYLAPFDPNDAQMMSYLDPDSYETGPPDGAGRPTIRRSVAGQIKESLMNERGLADDVAAAEARRQALRKLTCRRIAQWAINCADMRDADAIRTPFEYDENPWDGWNVVDSKESRVYPLDGDLTTNENRSYTREIDQNGWSAPVRNNGYKGASLADDYQMPAYDQTRGLVWGMERPELLLTEGMGGHDRRVTNEQVGNILPIGGAIPDRAQPGQPPVETEDDLDQFYRPKGWAFVEVYNPWNVDNPAPAELFREPGNFPRLADMNKDGVLDNNDVEVEGVLLDRVSDAWAVVRDHLGQPRPDKDDVDGDGDRSENLVAPSPVWRMICVEQHPQLRNDDPFDNQIARGPYSYPSMERGVGVANRAPQAYRDLAAESIKTEDAVRGILAGQAVGDRSLRAVRQRLKAGKLEVPNPPRIPDPDFPGFDPDITPTVSRSGERFVVDKPLEYVEREWYFTRGPNITSTNVPGVGAAFSPADIKLCLPDRPVRVELRKVGATVNWPDGVDERSQLWPEGITRMRIPNTASAGDMLIYPRRFPPVVRGDNSYRSLPLAPILPGQYGVIGSAGTEYGRTVPGAGIAADRNAPLMGSVKGSRRELGGRYVTRIGRGEGEDLADGRNVRSAVSGSRRIELVPNPNPYLHQVLIGRNFGDEYRLMGPAGADNEYQVNATDPSRMPTAADNYTTTIAGNSIRDLREFNESAEMPAFFTHPRGVRGAYEIDPTQADDMRLYAIRPAVAIPVAGMNISEPIDGYILRRAELDNDFAVKWNPDEYAGEGTFGNKSDAEVDPGYDTPFDIAPELTINHTTPNYRSIHLQRLANPLLAWNPEPIKTDGTIHPQHDVTRPVNPYLTIDSMSLDVTAMNSITKDEELIDPSATERAAGEDAPSLLPRTDVLVTMLTGGGDPSELHKQAHYRPILGDVVVGGAGGQSELNDSGKIIMTLATNNRGANQLALEYGEDPGNGTLPPLEATLQPGRMIWKRERPNQLIDVLDSRIDRTSIKESRGTYPVPAAPVAGEPIAIAVNDILQATGNLAELSMDFTLQHSLGYDNSAVIRQYFLNPDYDAGAPPAGSATRNDRKYFRGGVQLRGSFVSTFNYDPFDTAAGNFAYRVDLNGDGILGDIVGVPQVNDTNQFADDDPRTEGVDETNEGDYRDDITYPWLTWNDRPYASALEVLQVPASSSSRLTQEYNIVNPFAKDPPSRYDGFSSPILGADDAATALQTNAARLGSTLYPYGHLLNVFQAAAAPAVAVQAGDQAIPVGAPNYHRLMDYVHTPSRFVATDVLMDPMVFNAGAGVTLNDPRRAFQAPFNTVAKHREPGKINLNTIVGRTDPLEPVDIWSPVYDGLMHRVDDTNYIDYTSDQLVLAGHGGPAWRDVTLSRRGYSRMRQDRTGSEYQLYSANLLHPDFPSRFANPFRAADAGDLVPLPQLQQYSVDASLLRAHPYSPAQNSVWGNPGDDRLVDKDGDLVADGDLLFDNSAEAGVGDDILMVRDSGALPNSQKETAIGGVSFARLPIEPLFAESTTESSLDGGRNPGIAYGPMTRLANLTTTRSGVFGVWITVGFFEVSPADPWQNPDGSPNTTVQNRFASNRAIYDQVYPDGYQLGKEVNIDTGDTKRFRAFYLIDRTQPVAFKPGENINSDKAILLRRRIE